MFKNLPSGIEIQQWRIETSKGPILNSEELKQFESQIDAPLLPEMIFGRNTVRFTHLPTGNQITFAAQSAIRQWAENCSENAIQVACSSGWSEKRKDTIEKMVKQNYDWTFTTKYKGDLIGNERFVTAETTNEPIPLDQLTRPDPILFFDELILFEDELADNGSSMLTVKLRVMPGCFFLLLRFFLRVDDVLLRVIETRLFHQFGTSYLLRDYQEKEVPYDGLLAASEEIRQDLGLLTNQNLISSILQPQTTAIEKISLV